MGVPAVRERMVMGLRCHRVRMAGIGYPMRVHIRAHSVRVPGVSNAMSVCP